MLFFSQLFIMIYGLKGNHHKNFDKREREKKGREGGRENGEEIKRKRKNKRIQEKHIIAGILFFAKKSDIKTNNAKYYRSRVTFCLPGHSAAMIQCSLCAYHMPR